MSNTKKWLLGAAALLTAASLVPDIASAHECSSVPTMHGTDPLTAGGFQVLKTRNLYRTQDRPYAQIPTGAKLLVRAPAGVTEADLHRAASCSADATSPLSVQGAKIDVRRNGDLYELSVTANLRSAALEIQHRAEAIVK